mgnify:CR=1 FL=1|jgi:hypothetical protein
MNSERLMAGIFAGAGGLAALLIGAYNGDSTLQTAGLVMLSSMMSFFVGEKNGQNRQNQAEKA